VGSVPGDVLASGGYLTTSDEAQDYEWQGATDPSSLWTPYFETFATGIGSPIDPGNWFHLFVTGDFTNDTALAGGTNTFFLFLNGSRVELVPGGGTSAVSPVVSGASGQVKCSMENADGDFGHPFSAKYHNGPFSYTRSLSGVDPDPTITGSVPGFSIGLSGTEIGLPCQAVHAATDIAGHGRPAIKYADVQIWVGQYIDPTNADNLAKFISGGAPVNPVVAEAAFGAPTYRFPGPALGIGTNTGTGGDFTLTGTVTDAAPGP